MQRRSLAGLGFLRLEVGAVVQQEPSDFKLSQEHRFVERRSSRSISRIYQIRAVFDHGLDAFDFITFGSADFLSSVLGGRSSFRGGSGGRSGAFTGVAFHFQSRQGALDLLIYLLLDG